MTGDAVKPNFALARKEPHLPAMGVLDSGGMTVRIANAA